MAIENKPNLKIIIMIMVKISPWGSLNLQYPFMGVAGQKGWEALIYIHVKIQKWFTNSIPASWADQNEMPDVYCFKCQPAVQLVKMIIFYPQ